MKLRRDTIVTVLALLVIAVAKADRFGFDTSRILKDPQR
jgi:hypothetical protein